MTLIADWGHPLHVHDVHQFLYVPIGRITVSAAGLDHLLTPAVGLWIPAGVPHSARFEPESLVLSELFEPDEHLLPYTEPTAVNVTDKVRLMLLGRRRSSTGTVEESRVFAALSTGPRASLPLPRPVSPAAAAVARELARFPGDPRTAEEWAQSLFTSSTSLRRAFRAETGLAFSEWRTRLRLNHSLDLLARGHLVSAVAARVGFASTNGYILAFRRYFGQTPGAFVKRSA